MNLKRKAILTAVLLLVFAALAAGCAAQRTPYEVNDSENFNVSIKFDANGGEFSTNAPVIVDAYDISGLAVNASGKVEIPILAPDDASRNKDAFKPVKNGYFLAGWYTQRIESTDADGNVTYTYADKWDFAADRVQVDPNVQHTSQEPVLTLYAAWAPLYKFEFYDRASGDLLGSYQLDPTVSVQLQVPAWNEQTGAMEMYKFAKRPGYTFDGVYYDAEGKEPVEELAVTHHGYLAEETGAVENSVMRLYTDWVEGEWYHIYTAEQFADNFSLDGCYEICDDLDFAEEIWPTAMMYGNFTGTIRGNDHFICNVTLEQTNNSKPYAGLFGQLAETAVLENLNFENITFIIKSGTRVAGTAYGLLAGSISQAAKLDNINIFYSWLMVDSGCYFGTDDYVIGLVCGIGTTDIDDSEISCLPYGNDSEKLNVTVEDGVVTVTYADAE